VERASATHWIGGWVGPRASLDMLTWYWELNPSHPACSLSLYWICYPGSCENKERRLQLPITSYKIHTQNIICLFLTN